jgi:hypothetical protein
MSYLLAGFAISISIIGLWLQWRSSKRNMILSIQRELITMMSILSAKTNDLWADIKLHGRSSSGAISEMLVACEVLDRTVEVYVQSSPDILRFKIDIEFIYWKSITPSLRSWIKNDYNKKNDLPGGLIKNIERLQKRFRPIYEGKV